MRGRAGRFVATGMLAMLVLVGCDDEGSDVRDIAPTGTATDRTGTGTSPQTGTEPEFESPSP